MKEIKLIFNKNRTTVSGNDYGQQTFREQVASKCDEDEKVVVYFPDYIEMVGMSFAQGFIHDIAEKYGAPNVKNHLLIKSRFERVLQTFKEAVEYYD